LNDHDAVFEYTNLHPRDYKANDISDKNLIFVVFFSIRKKFIDAFTNELTLEKYLKSKDTMLETYLMEVIDKFEKISKFNSLPIGIEGYKIKKFDDSQFKLYLGDAVLKSINVKKEDCDVYTTISEANGFDLIKKQYKNEQDVDVDWYFIFGGNNIEFNKFEIFIFEISKTIDKIVININGNVIEANNITNKYYSLVTNYSIKEIESIIDNKKLSIFINDEKVDENIINVMKYQGIQPKFE
jgi:hypothetical protein